MSEYPPDTEPGASLVPPDRDPPTAVGLELLPSPEPIRPYRSRPTGFRRVVELLRSVTLSAMDVADALADAVTGKNDGDTGAS